MTIHQNTPNLPVTVEKGAAVASRTNAVPAIAGNRKTRRAIKKVLDARGDEAILMPVDAVLDVLTAVDLTKVRREIASERDRANILFRCAQCNSPVYLAVSHTASTGDGRGAFFKHYGGTPKTVTGARPMFCAMSALGSMAGTKRARRIGGSRSAWLTAFAATRTSPSRSSMKNTSGSAWAAASRMSSRSTKASRSPLSCSLPE